MSSATNSETSPMPVRALALRRDSLDAASAKDRLAASAARTRSMGDLRQGILGLNDLFGVMHVVAYGLNQPWEDEDTRRHIRRGAALTHLLLKESLPDFAPDSSGFLMDILSPEPTRNPRRDAFGGARDALMEARQKDATSERWELSAEGVARNRADFKGAVDYMLQAAGLDGAVDTAIGNLTGEGLEEPTQPIEARYGATLLLLGIGIVEG